MMSSVARRITEYNHEVGQPRGGLLSLKRFALEHLDDGFGVINYKQENLPGGSVGSTVDYLTRLGQVRSDADEESRATALIDVFGVSIAGAMRISERTENTSAAADARSALWELGSVQDDHDAVSFVVDETAVGKESGLPEFNSLTHVGLFNPRLGTVHRMAVADVPADVIELVRRDVIGYTA